MCPVLFIHFHFRAFRGVRGLIEHANGTSHCQYIYRYMLMFVILFIDLNTYVLLELYIYIQYAHIRVHIHTASQVNALGTLRVNQH